MLNNAAASVMTSVCLPVSSDNLVSQKLHITLSICHSKYVLRECNSLQILVFINIMFY